MPPPPWCSFPHASYLEGHRLGHSSPCDAICTTVVAHFIYMKQQPPGPKHVFQSISLLITTVEVWDVSVPHLLFHLCVEFHFFFFWMMHNVLGSNIHFRFQNPTKAEEDDILKALKVHLLKGDITY